MDISEDDLSSLLVNVTDINRHEHINTVVRSALQTEFIAILMTVPHRNATKEALAVQLMTPNSKISVTSLEEKQ